MKNTLTLREVGHAGSGLDMSKWDKVFQYEVLGLPPTEQAWIAEMDHVWQILRVKDGVQGHWTGSYKSAEEALAALEILIRSGGQDADRVPA